MAYSQNDPAWKNTALGFDSPDPSSPNHGTIGMYGCYVTGIANVCKYAGNDLNPAQVNDLCKQNGWFVRGDLINNDGIPALLCGNLQFVGRTKWTGATPMDFFADASDPNVAYIIEIDASKAPGIQTHFTMVWGTHGANDLEIDDSWDGVRKPLSHYGPPAVIILSAMKFVKQAAAPAGQPYSVEAITPKQVRLNKDVNQWNMSYDNFTAMNDHPAGRGTAGETLTVTAICHHHIGYNYYLQDANVPAGWNIVDCDDIAVPVPEAPLPPPPAPPSGAAPYPSPIENYTLVVDCPGYVTSNSAANHLGASTTVTAGDYSVFNKRLDVNNTVIAINVTRKPGVAGTWINPSDNHVPESPTPAPTENGWLGPRQDGTPEPTPVPEPLKPVVRESQIPKKPSEVPIGTQADNTWKSSYKALNNQNRSEEYELVQPWTMKEYSGKKNPVPLSDGTKLNITGTFIKNGVKFYRTRSARDEYFAWWYSIPAIDDNSRAVLVKKPPAPAQPPDDYLSLQDVAYYLKSDLSKLKIWDVIRRKKVNK